MSDRAPEQADALTPQYKNYRRQKCFIAYSERAPWAPDLLSACNEVLERPEFDLEPDSARKHFKPDISLRQKALELIANARCGIYDLSYWPNDGHGWEMPRNVLIELGMAIALNRPTLLLRHTRNREAGLRNPECLQGCEDRVIEFGGESTLKDALQRHLARWIDVPPEEDWWSRYCIFGGRQRCQYREAHPQAKRWGEKMIRCEIHNGDDADRQDFRAVISSLLDRYQNTAVGFSDALSSPEGYEFVLCGICQKTRSSSFGIYRVSTQTPADAYIAYGMSVALETQLGYTIPRILLTEDVGDVPSLLSGYEVIVACNDTQRRSHLREVLPTVMQQLSETQWKPRPLPFIENTIPTDRVQPGCDLGGQISATSNSLDLDQTLGFMVTNALQLTGMDSGVVYLFDEAGRSIVQSFGIPADFQHPVPRLSEENGMTRSIIDSGRPIAVSDVETEAHVNPMMRDRGTRSLIGLPLKLGGRVAGVLYLFADQPRRFSEEDRAPLLALVDQAAIAIENARFVENAQRRIRDLEIVNEVGQIANAKLGTQDLFSAIVSLVADKLRCTHCTLFLAQTEDDQLVLVPRATSGLYSDQIMRRRFTPGEGLAGWVFQNGVSVVLPDVRNDFRFAPAVADSGRPRSIAIVPVRIGDQTIGVISAVQDAFGWFSDQDGQLLEVLAEQVGIAIQRAKALDSLSEILHPTAQEDRTRLPEIRQYLISAYSDDEFGTLCSDYFRDVYDNFTAGMTKAQKIGLLLDYCQPREQLPNLLAALEHDRPQQYRTRFVGNVLEARPAASQPQRDSRQVFISHAHEDTEFAHRLTGDLQRNGWRVWIAPDSIRPGEKWAEAINRGLEESGVFVVALTPTAMASNWVKVEMDLAIELAQRSEARFIPLLVSECRPPVLWNAFRRINFTERYLDGLNALLATLEEGQNFEEQPERESNRDSDFRPGDEVVVQNGPLAGLHGVFQGPIGPSERVKILVRFLGESNVAEVPRETLSLFKVAKTKEPRRRGTRGGGRQIEYTEGSSEKDSRDDDEAEQADGGRTSENISGEEKLLCAIFGERIDVPRPLGTEKREELTRVFSSLFGDLQGNEREVLERRFGLGSREGIVSSLQEVAELLDVKRDRVRSIEASALRRLRQPIRSEQLLPYYRLLYPKADQVE